MPVERRPPPPSQSSIVLLTHALPNPPRIPPIPSPLCAVYLLPTLMTLHDLAYEPSSPLYSPRYAPLLVGLYATILCYCSRLSPMLSHPASVKPIRSFQCDEQGDFASSLVDRLEGLPTGPAPWAHIMGESASSAPASRCRSAPHPPCSRPPAGHDVAKNSRGNPTKCPTSRPDRAGATPAVSTLMYQ
ncbi:hypothetical protein BD413DRAFT_12413 [Trametes elegans]|nr:hypothetical protein BD413DRAFT_12413 [Trametes elegans]